MYATNANVVVISGYYYDRVSSYDLQREIEEFRRASRVEHRLDVLALLAARSLPLETLSRLATRAVLARRPEPIPALVGARGPVRPAPRAPPVQACGSPALPSADDPHERFGDNSDASRY